MDRWRTVAATVALVSGVVVAAAQDPTWPPSEVFMLGAEEWLGSPATRAADGLPRLLLSGAPYDESSVLEAWTWAYLPSTDPEVVKNEACRNDVKAVIKAIRNPLVYAEVLLKGHLWPVILPDSWGKVPDGLLTGNFQPWGMMEECTMLHVHELIDFPLKPFDLNTTFDGKYCAVSFRKSTDVEEQPGPQPRIGAFMPAIPLYFYGTCMPSSCAADDLRVSLDARMSALGKQTSAVDCQTRNDTKTLEAADIVVIVVLTVLGGLLLAGAALDIGINYSDQQQLRKGPWRFLLAFSAYTNIKKIFAISNKKNPEVISCLHGMRVMSMTWVVWAHCYIFFYTYSTNLLGIQEVTDDVLDETVDNAGFSVDTFFFISGFLVTYGVLKEFSRVGRINWIMYYVHRVIRLAPPIALTGAVMATLARFLVFGPLAMHIERTVVEICQQYWWADFLFATNFMNHMRPGCKTDCSRGHLHDPVVSSQLLHGGCVGWLAHLHCARPHHQTQAVADGVGVGCGDDGGLAGAVRDGQVRHLGGRPGAPPSRPQHHLRGLQPGRLVPRPPLARLCLSYWKWRSDQLVPVPPVLAASEPSDLHTLPHRCASSVPVPRPGLPAFLHQPSQYDYLCVRLPVYWRNTGGVAVCYDGGTRYRPGEAPPAPPRTRTE